jgi:hypothetical protein
MAPLEAALRVTEGVSKVDEALQTLAVEISCQKTKFMVFIPNNRDFSKNEGERGRRTMMTTCLLK